MTSDDHLVSELDGIYIWRKSSGTLSNFIAGTMENFSLNSIADIYLLVKFPFCLFFFCFFLHVYLLPVMVNKDVWNNCADLGGVSSGVRAYP